MSDSFLDKFKNENYDTNTSEKKETIKSDKTNGKVFQDESSSSKTSETISKDVVSNTKEEIKEIGRHVEHDVDIDYEYQKKRKQRKWIMIGASIATTIIVVITLIMINLTTITDVVGQNVGEVKNWADANNISLEIEYVFSTEHDENIAVSQNISSGSAVFKGKTMDIEVSKGADPEEKIEIPDIQSMSLDEIDQWVEDYKLTNVKIKRQFSSEIETNRVIDFSFEEGVDALSYARKNQLQIVISRGEETFEKNIEVKDFTNKPRTEVEEWGRTNGVTIIFEEDASDTITKDMVISQNVPKGTLVSKEDTITIVISYGKAITIPNFQGIFKESADTNFPNLSIIVKEQYHGSIAYGGLISQSVPVNHSVREDDNMVILVYSIGKPYIDDLTTMTEKELAEYFYFFRVGGANITYTIEYISGDAELKGTIASASKRNEFINMNENIHIQIYR